MLITIPSSSSQECYPYHIYKYITPSSLQGVTSNRQTRLRKQHLDIVTCLYRGLSEACPCHLTQWITSHWGVKWFRIGSLRHLSSYLQQHPNNYGTLYSSGFMIHGFTHNTHWIPIQIPTPYSHVICHPQHAQILGSLCTLNVSIRLCQVSCRDYDSTVRDWTSHCTNALGYPPVNAPPAAATHLRQSNTL